MGYRYQRRPGFTPKSMKQFMIEAKRGGKLGGIVRGDSAFAREAIMGWCEEEEVFYGLGLARNRRLEELLAEEFKTLQAQIEAGKAQAPCRTFCEFTYRTLDSWSKERRVIGKAEILPKGENRKPSGGQISFFGAPARLQHENTSSLPPCTLSRGRIQRPRQ